jgi:hypothetical protein
MYGFCSKLVCLQLAIDKTLAYYEKGPVNYEYLMFYSTGTWSKLLRHQFELQCCKPVCLSLPLDSLERGSVRGTTRVSSLPPRKY